jgi:LysM repeat protein
MMKIRLIIVMSVVSVLLSSCVTPQTSVTGATANVYEQPTEDYYTVKRGDTLSSIARGYGISDFQIIARRNNLFSPYELGIGQELVIPLSNQPRYNPGIVTPQQQDRPVLGNRTPSYNYPSYSRPGCGVQVLSAKAFTHRCKLFSRCTGVNYVIKNYSSVARTVTIKYQNLEDVRVLRENIQIPADGFVEGNVYEVASTVGTQNLVISRCY